MAVVHMLHWLRGYSVVCVPSADAGKLMTLCAHNGILLWDAKHQKNLFYGCVHTKLYPHLEALAEQSGIAPNLLRSCGFPPLLHKNRKRVGVLLGIFIFLGLLSLSQQFVWKIEIEGMEDLQETRLLAVLEEVGVHRGALKKNIPLAWTAREVLIRVDEVSWSALNFHGTTAILKIRERTPPPPKIDTSSPANIVAAEDGQIKILQVTDGKAVRKEGETVRKGEVIISGVWQDQWGLTHFVRAGGKAYAHVPRSLTVKIPLTQDRYTITQLKQRKYLTLFGEKIPLFFYNELEGNYKTERFSYTPTFFGMSLPFTLEYENILFYESEKETISQEMALVLAQRRLDILERQTFAEKEVLSQMRSAAVENGDLVLRGEYELKMDIAKKQEILFQEYKIPDEKRKIPREGGY